MAQTKSGQQRRAGAPRGGNGREQDVARFEKQLATYLQKRIKPGLNSGAIPLLARSIAKELAEERSRSNGGAQAEEPVKDDDGMGAEDFEAEMHDLQAELGKHWIVSFSVKDGDAWLTAEKDDGSQHLEAQTASVLVKAVKLLNKGGGRTG
jgi:hypothetical protein